MATRKKTRPRADLGTVQQLPSGRWRAYYRLDGERFNAPHTFETERAGKDWLMTERADRLRGTWRDPRAGKTNTAKYLADWLAAKVELSASSRTSYATATDRWIVPRLEADGKLIELGALDLDQLTPAVVRRWVAIVNAATREAATRRYTYTPKGHPARLWGRDRGHSVADTGRIPPAVMAEWRRAGSPKPSPRLRESAEGVELGRATAARAYQVLRAAMTDAAADGLIHENPCRVKGAATTKPKERGTCTPDEISKLAAAMPAHLSAAVIVAAWSGLRAGELFGLARRHVNTEAGTLTVERSLSKQDVNGRTKTRASVRTVDLPRFVMDQLAEHMKRYTGHTPAALVFSNTAGQPVDSGNLSRTFRRARESIGRPELHWHDLRHTGATLAYAHGASVRVVQDRLGHSTSRAAMIYAHAADDAGRLLAERLDAAYGGAVATVTPIRGDATRRERRSVEPAY
jgi:integrase